MSTIFPQGYATKLTVYETQQAIVTIKDSFQRNLSSQLNLKRVSAPLFVSKDSGLNDDLNGVERPVGFDVPAAGGISCQIVHSLAKWKRLALKQYGFETGTGLYTDMNAVRRDEPELDNLHSVYVDQWDWEKVITREERNLDYLYDTVGKIVSAIADTEVELSERFPQLSPSISRDVAFVSSQELEDMWPDISPEEREYRFVKEHPTAFISGIGGKLRSGRKHGNRAPDYDDWDLNGDIFCWDYVLDREVELSSMGIRVDEESMRRQLIESGCEERSSLPFHRMLLNGELPLTIGGGIGQSRLCLVMMQCAHIGEVHAGVWDDETRKVCSENGIFLL
ncbi:MAG: aspartate--ammonia ligase [Oscillospiraceae bacterium]|nr:aspartate--ammonia ligase [Oscillospiraceae bacterium]